MLTLLGIWFIAINSISSADGDCIDFVSGTTTAYVHADTMWQWQWAGLSCCVSIINVKVLMCLTPYKHGKNTASVVHQMMWDFFTHSEDGQTKRVIREWRIKMQNSHELKMHCALLSWALHLPFI